MLKSLIIFLFLLFIPVVGICGDEQLLEIENLILAGDTNGAQKLFQSTDFILSVGGPYHYKVQTEVSMIIRYFEESARFNQFAENGKHQQAVMTYKNLTWAYERLPKNTHFSERIMQKINSSNTENITKYNALHAKVTAGKEQERKSKIEKRENEQRAFEEQVAQQDAERTAYEAKMLKLCGNDYNQIRVGMKLDRVMKCSGEFYLQGQTTKNGIIYDYYTRGDSWLYISKGRVVAWGD